LPDGQTYRIYLDAPAEPQVDEIAGSQKPIVGKVAYFILGGAGGGGAAWGIQAIVNAQSLPISPAKP
jgi:hypothetical protein